MTDDTTSAYPFGSSGGTRKNWKEVRVMYSMQNVLNFVRANPGCRPEQLIATFGADAEEFASRMVLDQELERWYSGLTPHYYFPGMKPARGMMRKKKPYRDQEQRIGRELADMGFSASVCFLPQQEDCYYGVITVATSAIVRGGRRYTHMPPKDAKDILYSAYLEAHDLHRSDLGRLIVTRFAERGAGVALCHHRDTFSSKRGTIIAEGRLLKLLKKEDEKL